MEDYLIVDEFEGVEKTRRSGQISETLAEGTRGERLVGPIQFGIGLLEQRHPQQVVSSSRIDKLA